MRNILIFLIGILIIVVEGSITNYFQIAGSSINFLLIYMTIISLYLDEMEVGILGALIGCAFAILNFVLLAHNVEQVLLMEDKKQAQPLFLKVADDFIANIVDTHLEELSEYYHLANIDNKEGEYYFINPLYIK